MMKLLTLFTFIFLSSAYAGSYPVYSTEYDPERDPFIDGKAAIELATKTQRRILIEVGGDWCKWCHILDAFIKSDPQIENALHSTFVVLKVNVSDVNLNEKFLSAFPKTLGYPHMYVAESDGHVIHSQDTAEFLVNKKYSKQQFIRFLGKWRLKPLATVTK